MKGTPSTRRSGELLNFQEGADTSTRRFVPTDDLGWWQARLEGWRKVSDGWMAHCPAHEDSKASLHFTVHSEVDFLFHCFAGCSWREVNHAAQGMAAGNWSEPEPESAPSLSIVHSDVKDALDAWAIYTGVPREEWISWGATDKNECVEFTWPGLKCRKVRKQGKEFAWAGGAKPSKPLLWPEPGMGDHSRIWLAEGESDCGVLRHLGFDAYTFGGVSSARGDSAEVLRAWGVAHVTICFDADKPGREASRKLSQELLEYDDTLDVHVLDIGPLIDSRKYESDIRDVYLRLGSQLGLELQLHSHLDHKDATVSSEDFSSRAPESVDWVCEPFVARGSLSLLCAVAKGGKTTWTFSLMREMGATGGELLGSFVAASRVLYMTEDPPPAWRLRRDSHMPNGADSHVRVVPANSMQGKSWAEKVSLIEKSVRVWNAEFLVVDTVPIWADIENENDATQVNRALEPLRRLAEKLNIAILAIHYYNKSGGFRGSTSFEAIPNIIIYLEGEGDTRTLKVKGKLSARDPQDISYKMRETENGIQLDKVVVSTRAQSEESSQLLAQEIKEVLGAEERFFTHKEICEMLGAGEQSDKQKVRRELVEMVARKELIADSANYRKSYKLYRPVRISRERGGDGK